MDLDLWLLGFVTLGTALAFGGRWAFKKVFGEPTPDPTQSPGAEPYSPRE
jgi:hypothetical protein